MYIDSHCHLDRIDLTPYRHDFAEFVQDAERQGVHHMLCIAIDLESYPAMRNLVADYDNISLSVGVHPNVGSEHEPEIKTLLALANDRKVIAIGETGLDYFHDKVDLQCQRQRFRNHIQVARSLNKPLIIHTREAGQASLDILEQQDAAQVGGIIHCFTEDWAYAQRALELNFYISFSGIVTFKNAVAIKEVAQKVPADRFLIETDSPYLAPAPFRGKPNYPVYVRYVAEQLAELRGVTPEQIARQSSDNFARLFAGQGLRLA
ncbi:MAG: TatD family hydrolase [Methylococcales bacterium]|nr:TatD family hydrolase [Methylococcales bacterium]